MSNTDGMGQLDIFYDNDPSKNCPACYGWGYISRTNSYGECDLELCTLDIYHVPPIDKRNRGKYGEL